MKESLLYKKIENEKPAPHRDKVSGARVQCQACFHYCILKPSQPGKCLLKENKAGKLYSLAYGKVASMTIEPMEKIGLFHFFPGTEALSLSTLGSNSKEFALREKTFIRFEQKNRIGEAVMLPQKIVKTAIQYGTKNIAYKGEPSVALSFVFETMRLAKRRKIKNIWTSNGFFSKEAFELAGPLLSAININLQTLNGRIYRKSFGIKIKPILDNLIKIKKAGIHLEITTIAIPELTTERDFREIARFIKKYLDKETPWHILRFLPEISWRLRHYFPTPIEDVQRACDIGMEEGLLYVYGGNVIGLASEDTYCPRCHQKMIDRTGYIIERLDKNGKCSNCQEDLNIYE